MHTHLIYQNIPATHQTLSHLSPLISCTCVGFNAPTVPHSPNTITLMAQLLGFLQHFSCWPSPCSGGKPLPQLSGHPLSPGFLSIPLSTHPGYLQGHTLFCMLVSYMLLTTSWLQQIPRLSLQTTSIFSTLWTNPENFHTLQTSQFTHPDSFIHYLLTA